MTDDHRYTRYELPRYFPIENAKSRPELKMLMTQDTPTGDSQPSEAFDIWAILVRHSRLLGMSILFVLSLGGLYYCTAPPTFQSTASILIETKTNPTFDHRSREERPKEVKNVETHAFTIRSRMIVELAFANESFGLADLVSLEEADDKTGFVMERLTSQVAEDETSAILLTYEGRDAEDCRRIVRAITQTYEDYLGEQIQDISTKTSELIVKAKDELLHQIQAKESSYHDFQRTAPLMWKSGEGINLHRERQSELESERSNRLIERSKLVAKIEAVELAIANGGDSRDAIYFEAISELRPKNDDEDFIVEREAARGYSVELSREFVELVMKEKEMSERYGPGHPDLVSIKNRIAAMREMLDETLGNNDSDGPNMGPAVEPFVKETDYVEVYRHLLRKRLTALNAELRQLNEAYLAEQKNANQMQTYLAEDQMRRSDIMRLSKLFDAVVARLEEITLIRDYGGDTMRVLEQARLGEQIAPNLLLVVLVSLVAGTLLGSGAAVVMDLTEATFRSPAEIRKVMQVPVIGRIPRMDLKHAEVDPSLPGIQPIVCAAHRVGSNDAEAYRAVRTALYFSNDRQDLRVLQVTSPMPGDGKSTLVSNLAVSIANSGKRVVVLDADFRKPVVHTIFGLEADLGLANAVAGEIELPRTIHASGIENLSIIGAGKPSANPSELLSSDRFVEIIDRLKDLFDFVLIDTPPLLAVTDPSIVSARVDAVLLTMRIYKGVRAAAERSQEILNGMDAKLFGVVVNKIDDRTNGGYGRYGFGSGYGYGYGYGRTYGYGPEHAPSPPKGASHRRRQEKVAVGDDAVTAARKESRS